VSTPSDVLAQASRLRSGTRFEQARAGATALSTFLQLSADDKRDLAVAVAQRVAPELVPRIQAETGVDLTAEQSRAVLDMIARLDGDDLGELSRAMASPAARRATLGAVGDAAAAATGLDDVVSAPATPAADSPAATPTTAKPLGSAATADSDAAAAAGHRAAAAHPDDARAAEADTLAGRIVDLEARLAAAETLARTHEQSLEAARDHLADEKARADAVAAQLREAANQADITRREHEGEVDELRRQLRRSRRELEEAGGGSESSRAIAARPPPRVARTSAFTSMPSFDAGLEDGVPPVPELFADITVDTAVRTSPTALGGVAAADPAFDPDAASISQLVATLAAGSRAAALRTIRVWLPRLGDSSPGDRVRVLEAVPDGWARRRVLQRMVEAGITTQQDVAALGLLSMTGDQVFAAGSMLDAGMDPQSIARHVTPATRARLARRSA